MVAEQIQESLDSFLGGSPHFQAIRIHPHTFMAGKLDDHPAFEYALRQKSSPVGYIHKPKHAIFQDKSVPEDEIHYLSKEDILDAGGIEDLDEPTAVTVLYELPSGGGHYKTCPTCGGDGAVELLTTTEDPCQHCGGEGEVEV